MKTRIKILSIRRKIKRLLAGNSGTITMNYITSRPGYVKRAPRVWDLQTGEVGEGTTKVIEIVKGAHVDE